jgi:hypothetical protein
MQKWECPCSFVYDQLKNITMWWVGEKRKINIACHNLQFSQTKSESIYPLKIFTF